MAAQQCPKSAHLTPEGEKDQRFSIEDTPKVQVLHFFNCADVGCEFTDTSPATTILYPLMESTAPALFGKSNSQNKRSKDRGEDFVVSLLSVASCFKYKLPQKYSKIQLTANDPDIGEQNVHDG